LFAGKLQGDVNAKRHQFRAVFRLLQEVAKEIVDLPQIGRFRRRAFHPSHDRIFSGAFAVIGTDSLDTVAHPNGSQRIGSRQLIEIGCGFERILFAMRNRVLLVNNLRAKPLGLAIRIGHRVHLVDAEIPRAFHIRAGAHPKIGRELGIVRADELGCEPHQDRNAGNKVDGSAVEHSEITLEAVHLKGHFDRRVKGNFSVRLIFMLSRGGFPSILPFADNNI
jgi:plasmid stabilization system protein ParE